MEFPSNRGKIRFFSFDDQTHWVFAPARRYQHDDAQIGIRAIAPRVRNASPQAHKVPGLSIEDFVAVGDSCRPFDNERMFVLSFMDMQWRAVARTRQDLDERIEALGVFGGHADEALFARSCFQPLPLFGYFDCRVLDTKFFISVIFLSVVLSFLPFYQVPPHQPAFMIKPDSAKCSSDLLGNAHHRS